MPVHPRYRRALIPALLIALLVVVIVAAVAKAAFARPVRPVDGSGDSDSARRVSTITDSRVPESSALAFSTRHPALVYTVNDSGHAPVVYAVRVRTGEVVSATTLTGYHLEDVEALAVGDDGMLWVADIGDNNGVRHDIALYAIEQPGTTDSSVRPERYRLRYSDGSQNAETLLADPRTGTMYVVSKGFLGGQVYRLPGELDADDVNVMRPVEGVSVPALVTDGAYLPDGSGVVLRTYNGMYGYDSRTWARAWTRPLPEQPQGESLAVEPGGRSALIGSEGLPAPLLRVRLPDAGFAGAVASGVISRG